MIKAVLFDFGGVLTEGGKQGFIRHTVAALVGLPEDQVDIGDLHYMLRRGKGTEDQFFAEINKRYGTMLDRSQFLAATKDLTVRSPQVYALAEALRSHGIRTGILSNIFAMSAQDLRQRGFYDGFDPIVLSCDEGYAKPDPEFYKIGIAKVGVNPDEIVFVDDQDKCMPPAKALGIHTVQATSPDQVVADVRQCILQQNGIDVLA